MAQRTLFTPASGDTENRAQQAPTAYLLSSDPHLARGLEQAMRAAGHPVAVFGTATALLDHLKASMRGCVLVDADSQTCGSHLAVAETVRTRAPQLTLVVTTAGGDVRSAVRALRAGAVDVFERPLPERQIARRLDALLRQARSASGA